MARTLSSFYRFLTKELFQLHKSGDYSDLDVHCCDGGHLKMSGFLLASISPVVASSLTQTSVALDHAVMLPDITKSELENFIDDLFNSCGNANNPELDEDSLFRHVKVAFVLGMISLLPASFTEPILAAAPTIIVQESPPQEEEEEEYLMEFNHENDNLDIECWQNEGMILETSNNYLDFNCSLCPNVTFVNDISLFNHINSCHKEIIDHVGSGVESFEIAKISLKSGHKKSSSCQCCDAFLKTFADNLVMKNVPLQKLVMACPHCRKRYKRGLTEVMSHLDTVHSEDHHHSSNKSVFLNKLDFLYSEDDLKAITCEFCDQNQSSLQGLDCHLPTCSSNPIDVYFKELFACRLCGQRESSKTEYEEHVLKEHADIFAICDECGLLQSKKTLALHKARVHDPLVEIQVHAKCKRCQILFKSYMDNKRCKSPIKHENLIFTCPHCQLLYTAPNTRNELYTLLSHLKNYHNNQEEEEELEDGEIVLKDRCDSETFKCTYCKEKSFKNHTSYNTHISGCGANKKGSVLTLSCLKCTFRASSPSVLKKHELKKHTTWINSQFSCEHCEKTFKRKEGLENHAKVEHFNLSPQKKIQCKLCHVEFKTKKQFWNHGRHCRHDKGLILRHSCLRCSKKFKNLSDLNAHVQIHNGAISCPVHNVVFRSEKDIFQHMRLDVDVDGGSSSSKMTKCCMCGSQLRTVTSLCNHLRTHFQCKPYTCSKCDESFCSSGHLTSHVDNKHNSRAVNADRKYKCQYCDKAFKFHSHKREHEEGIHNKAKIKCHLCPSTFATKKRLQKHWRLVHKLTSVSMATNRVAQVLK